MLLPHIRLFQKIKRSGTNLPCLIFCIIFKQKYFSCYVLSIDQVSLCGCLYFIIFKGLSMKQITNFFKRWEFCFKGYLCCKMITSQNVSSEVKNFFISRKSYVPFSRYTSFCVITISWFAKPVTSWWVLVMRQGSFLNISFEPQLIKSPNLSNW